MKFTTDSIKTKVNTRTGRMEMTLTCMDLPEDFESFLKEDRYTVDIRKARQGRSLDANAYYQVLVRQCAEARGISHAEYHNRSLAEVGIPWADANGKTPYVLMKDDDAWLKVLQGGTHYAPTPATEDRKGITYRWFYLLLPSRFMDSKQMAMLIDYVVQDAKSLGIKTLEDMEIDRMVEAWGNKK